MLIERVFIYPLLKSERIQMLGEFGNARAAEIVYSKERCRTEARARKQRCNLCLYSMKSFRRTVINFGQRDRAPGDA